MCRLSFAEQQVTSIQHLDIINLPMRFFRVADPEEQGGASPFARPETVEEPERTIRCRQCGESITRRAEMVEMYGRHIHSCRNPAGLMFDIGCFAEADGCVRHGESTMAHTWFPGYSWRVALCGGCLEHLGWHFEGPARASFYGLILDRLVDEQ